MTLNLDDIIKSTWQIGPRRSSAPPWQEAEIIRALQGSPLTTHQIFRRVPGLGKHAARSWMLKLHRQGKIESVGRWRWRLA